MGNNLPESMYEYRPERTPDNDNICTCKICDLEITETDKEVQQGMCDFCYRNEPVETCERCQDEISQYQSDNFDDICEECIEERQNDAFMDGESAYVDPSDISNIDYD